MHNVEVVSIDPQVSYPKLLHFDDI